MPNINPRDSHITIVRRSAASPWKEGDWISFELPDGERLCGRHCGQMPASGTILLFNSEWGYAVALAPSLLEQQRADGRAHDRGLELASRVDAAGDVTATIGNRTPAIFSRKHWSSSAA